MYTKEGSKGKELGYLVVVFVIFVFTQVFVCCLGWNCFWWFWCFWKMCTAQSTRLVHNISNWASENKTFHPHTLCYQYASSTNVHQSVQMTNWAHMWRDFNFIPLTKVLSFLGIYTKVKYYLSWIKNTARDGQCTVTPSRSKTPNRYKEKRKKKKRRSKKRRG